MAAAGLIGLGVNMLSGIAQNVMGSVMGGMNGMFGAGRQGMLGAGSQRPLVENNYYGSDGGIPVFRNNFYETPPTRIGITINGNVNENISERNRLFN